MSLRASNQSSPAWASRYSPGEKESVCTCTCKFEHDSIWPFYVKTCVYHCALKLLHSIYIPMFLHIRTCTPKHSVKRVWEKEILSWWDTWSPTISHIPPHKCTCRGTYTWVLKFVHIYVYFLSTMQAPGGNWKTVVNVHWYKHYVYMSLHDQLTQQHLLMLQCGCVEMVCYTYGCIFLPYMWICFTSSINYLELKLCVERADDGYV